jgi:hypothetical protein
MVCYPEVQKKAQKELDEVLNGILPEHSDIVSLPVEPSTSTVAPLMARPAGV